jgi:hypothetical protein
MFSSYSLVLAVVAVFLSIALGDNYECPSSPAKSHAGCQVYTVFENQCSAVQQEMMKRVNGQADGTWSDPHNNGTYALIDGPNGYPATWQFSR